MRLFKLPQGPADASLRPRASVRGGPGERGAAARRSARKKALLTLDGRAYRGKLELVPQGGFLRVVNIAALESYLQGVVAGEVPYSWPPRSLKAQAVAARSYALANLVKGKPFDLYSDVRSQVYGGVAGEKPSTSKAVAATAGQVVLYGGQGRDDVLLLDLGRKDRERRGRLRLRGSVPRLATGSVGQGVAVPSLGPGPARRAHACSRSSAWTPASSTRPATPTPSGRLRSLVVQTTAGPETVPAALVRTALGLRSTWITVGVLRLDGPVDGRRGVRLDGAPDRRRTRSRYSAARLVGRRCVVVRRPPRSVRQDRRRHRGRRSRCGPRGTGSRRRAARAGCCSSRSRRACGCRPALEPAMLRGTVRPRLAGASLPSSVERARVGRGRRGDRRRDRSVRVELDAVCRRRVPRACRRDRGLRPERRPSSRSRHETSRSRRLLAGAWLAFPAGGGRGACRGRALAPGRRARRGRGGRAADREAAREPAPIPALIVEYRRASRSRESGRPLRRAARHAPPRVHADRSARLEAVVPEATAASTRPGSRTRRSSRPGRGHRLGRRLARIRISPGGSSTPRASSAARRRADALGHGTFVAGLIGAGVDNGVGIAGLAPSAQLLVAKVVTKSRAIPVEAEAKAIRWAVDNGARVINMSLGGLRDPLDPSATPTRGSRPTRSRTPSRTASSSWRRSATATRRRRARGSTRAIRLRFPMFSASARSRERALSRRSRTATRSTTTSPRRGSDPLDPSAAADGALPRLLGAGILELRPRGVPRGAGDVVRRAAGERGRRCAAEPAPDASARAGHAILERTAVDLDAATGCAACGVGRDASRAGAGSTSPPRSRLSKRCRRRDGYETNDDVGSRAYTASARTAGSTRPSTSGTTRTTSTRSARKEPPVYVGLTGR